jgi:hypothetical protein
MKTKPARKTKSRVPKSVLRLPDIEVAKSAVLNSLSCPDAQRGYRHAIDEFVDWYYSVRDYRSARRLSSVTGCIWNLAISPQRRSTFDSGLSAGWHTRHQTAVSSAATWLRGYGASKASRSWESDSATG